MNHRVLAVLLISLGVVLAPAAAAPVYDLSVPGSIDTPKRTVSHQGSSYTISSIVAIDPGEDVTVSVTKPDEPVRVYAYRNDDGATSVQDSIYLTEDDSTATFDTDGWQTGSYMFAVYANGTHRDVLPAVLEGYDTSLSTPDSTVSRSVLDVSLQLSAGERTSSPHSVEFVFANESTHARVSGDGVSKMEYSGKISLDEFAPGKYRLYAVVYSQESTPSGGNEIVAVSQPVTISIESGSVDESNGGVSGTTTKTTSAMTTTASSTTTTTAMVTTSTPASTTTSAPTSTTASTSPPTTTTDEVIMSATSTTTTPSSTPAFPANVIGALAILLLIWRLW